jgi:hypothetical protein
MSTRRRIIVSAIAGVGITGIGAGLCAVGAWGPCGPGDALAVAGFVISIGQLPSLEYLLIQHGVLASEVFPRTATWEAVRTGCQFALPVVFWSALVFTVSPLICAVTSTGRRIGKGWRSTASRRCT